MRRLIKDDRVWKILIRVAAALLFASGCYNARIGLRCLSFLGCLSPTGDDLLMMIGFSLPAFGLAALKMTTGAVNWFYRCRALGIVAIVCLGADMILWHAYWTAAPLMIFALTVYLPHRTANLFAQRCSASDYFFSAGLLGVGSLVLLVPGTMVLMILLSWHIPLPECAERGLFEMFMLPPIAYLPRCLIQAPGHIPIPTPLGTFILYHCPGIALLVLAVHIGRKGRCLAGQKMGIVGFSKIDG